MRIDLAIIGGTGIGSRLAELPGRALNIQTAEGLLRGRVVEFANRQVLAIQRHAAGHALPPHRVPYAAMALGLKALGINHCLATAAVGSLRVDWPIGTLVACTDFIDVSGRNLTLYGAGATHTPMAKPFSFALQQALGAAASARAVYVQVNGPRYESFAEIHAYATLGADVVGMTAASEAVLMREAGVQYGCLAIVTNLAAGLGPEPHHAAVADVMSERAPAVFETLARAVALLQ